jgi:hypothetical protein
VPVVTDSECVAGHGNDGVQVVEAGVRAEHEQEGMTTLVMEFISNVATSGEGTATNNGKDIRRPIEDLDANPHLFRVTVRLKGGARVAYDVTIAKDQEYCSTPFTADTVNFPWRPRYFWFVHEVLLRDDGQWQLIDEGSDNEPYPTALGAFDAALHRIMGEKPQSLNA